MEKLKRYDVKFDGNFGSNTFGSYYKIEGTKYCLSMDVEVLEKKLEEIKAKNKQLQSKIKFLQIELAHKNAGI